MKKALLLIVIAIVVFAAILVGRALMLPSRQVHVAAAPQLNIDRNAALQRFSRSIQFKTVSYDSKSAPQPVEHDAFLAWLPTAYPRVHAQLQREVLNGRGLLFTWRGSDPHLQPLVLMGHYDVVPVEPGTESKWEQAPFSGAVTGGFVWGRGTLDDKLTVISILEAIESLLGENYQPKRTIILAFGPDEEIGGTTGAALTAHLLETRGIRPIAVIDEGGAVLKNSIAGPTPVAFIGIAEKGAASIELRADGSGGHSSMPPPRTEVGVIAHAIDRVQSHPFKPSIRGAAAEMFRWLAPELPFAQRVLFSNVDLLSPLISLRARQSHSLNAIIRTTTAPTMVNGGVKSNVIPSHADAVINFRILPGETVKSVVDHVTKVIDDPGVKVSIHEEAWEPSPVSSPAAPSFIALQKTVSSIYPEAIVAPYLVVGATDSRYYEKICPNIYRFVAAVMNESELDRIHGTNERVAVDSYFQTIRFYRALITNFQS
jgi:carboxypeptidase PM20D1